MFFEQCTCDIKRVPTPNNFLKTIQNNLVEIQCKKITTTILGNIKTSCRIHDVIGLNMKNYLFFTCCSFDTILYQPKNYIFDLFIYECLFL